MADRIVDLKSIPSTKITQAEFDWYLHEEYLVPEAIELTGDEIDEFRSAADRAFRYYTETITEIIDHALWDDFKFPHEMREMIQHSHGHKHPHILGRFDFGGGIDGLPIGLLEFNADTCTMLPESSYFQSFFKEETFSRRWVDFNFLHRDLVQSFKQLLQDYQDREATLLVTSLGYIEDQLNAKVIVKAAEEAGFEVLYTDLENVVFEDDGVYVEFDEGDEMKFDFMFKFVPWEFIMFEEPELLKILRDLQLNDEIIILNPAHSILMQSKAILPHIYRKFHSDDIILQASMKEQDFRSLSYVSKSIFGRMGENIKMFDAAGNEIEKTDGDFGNFPSVHQKYTPLYKDEEFNYYQAGVYVTYGESCALSFRRCETMIIDEDAEFVPHFMSR